MKALVYTAPNTVEYRQEPSPSLIDGDALVQVEAVGICGSDLHAYLGHDSRRVPPLILGHEVCGTVIEGTSTGKHVVVNPLITCGECDDCLNGLTNLCVNRKLVGMNRPGAFADQLTIPEKNLVEVPAQANPVQLALTEPAAVSLHAVRLVEQILPRPLSEGASLVIGGGAVGLLCVLFLVDYGCKEIELHETNNERRAVIEDLGICKVTDPTKSAIRSGRFAAVFDAVGAPVTRKVAIESAKAGGVVMHIGLADASGPIDVRKMTLSEIAFIGTYTYTALDFRMAARKIANGDLGSLDWVDERPLSDGSQAFHELIENRVASPKIVLRPQLS